MGARRAGTGSGLLLGLDVGTSAVKGVLTSFDARVRAQAEVAYPMLTPRPGWVEQHPEDWWQATVAVLRRLSAAADAPILALGLAGQQHGAVFLDRDGSVIRPALLWNDQRTYAQCDEIEARVGPETLRRLAGNPALTGFQAPKILWLREREPESWRRVAHVLLPKDYVRYRLTGVMASDASDAAGTLLLDVRARAWSDEILGALEIPRRWLPAVFESPEPSGSLASEAARATGLAAGLPVAAGAGDNAAAALSCGVVEAGTAMLSLGTSGTIFAHSDELRIDPDGALHAFCHAVPNRYHLMGVVLAAGGSLSWFREAVAKTDDYDALVRSAGTVVPGADGLFFLPYLCGERTPHRDPHARAAWVGLTLTHERAHLTRAVLEGVAFALKDSLVRIQALDVRPQRLRMVGGGSRSPLWRSILASVLGVALEIPRTESAGAALGAALLASVTAGVYDDVATAAAAVQATHTLVEPDPEMSPVYAELYERYTRLYPALSGARVWPQG